MISPVYMYRDRFSIGGFCIALRRMGNIWAGHSKVGVYQGS